MSCAPAASSASPPSPCTPTSTATPLHVRFADEAYALGGQTAAESYLNTEAILDAIERSGADGVHPGYGFFSENADFARAITERGRHLDRPAARGDRGHGRQDLVAAARPQRADVAGGARHASSPITDADEVVAFGERVRLAGRDQGRVRRRRPRHEGRRTTPTRRAAAFESAQREAQAYFGRSECYIERYLTRPRHVEMQVFADTHGNVRVARRARLLDAAPPPEADRGEPGARAPRRRSARRWARPR